MIRTCTNCPKTFDTANRGANAVTCSQKSSKARQRAWARENARRYREENHEQYLADCRRRYFEKVMEMP